MMNVASKNSLHSIVLISILICTSTIVFAGDSTQQAIEDGLLGMDAYHHGRYRIALWFLDAAIAESPNELPERRLWSETKAFILWETGRDLKLLDYTETQLPGQIHETWWCHVLERRGHAHEASTCWYRMGDERRARRAVRTDSMTEILTAPWTVYGYRPGPQ